LSAHGPFDGQPAATGFAPRLALTDATLAATCPAPMPHPDEPTLPDDAWRPLPAEFARAARPALADSHAAVLVLLDRTGEMLAAVGPFANQAAAGHPGMTCRHPRRRP
jgi:hypothetical protein